MEDPVYQKAVERCEKLRGQMQNLAAELEEVERWLRLYGQFAGSAERPKTGARKRVRYATGPQLLVKAKTILGDGKPLPTRALLEQLRAHGLEVRGKDDSWKVVNLSQILGRERKRNGTFMNDRALGWSLAKAPKSKSPVNGETSKGPDLRGNSTLSTRESHPQG